MAKSRAAGHSLDEECGRLTRYLVDRAPTEAEVALYRRAVAKYPETDSILDAARRGWLLPYLDAGTAWLRLDCPLRRRLLIMTAILEASPRHTDRFLPKSAPLVKLVSIGFRAALRTAWHLPLGLILVRRMRRS
jgi:hypothetical protein